MKKRIVLLEQLNIVKKAKDRANRKRTTFYGVTNQDLILELSNLNKIKALNEQLFEAKWSRRNGREEDAYEFLISKAEIETKLETVNERIKEIKESMTNFNKSTTVRVVIFEELKLF